MKTCPHCAEPIPDEARVCRACGRRVAASPVVGATLSLAVLVAISVYVVQNVPDLALGDWAFVVFAVALISAFVVGLGLLVAGRLWRRRVVGLGLCVLPVAIVAGLAFRARSRPMVSPTTAVASAPRQSGSIHGAASTPTVRDRKGNGVVKVDGDEWPYSYQTEGDRLTALFLPMLPRNDRVVLTALQRVVQAVYRVRVDITAPRFSAHQE